MAVTLCEQLLNRIIAYMEGMGVAVDATLAIQALALVESALQQSGEDPFAYVMSRIPDTFALPQLELPPLSPAINRGSIGYLKS